jgi:hypothetical protein
MRDESERKIDYFKPVNRYIVSFCPFCDHQALLYNVFQILYDESLKMRYCFDGESSQMCGYYCAGCECIVYKNIEEGRI